jgi:hypothetical protein
MRVAINIGKETAYRTPGLNFASAQWYREMKAGGARQDMAVGKLAIGTAVAGWAAYLAHKKIITGTGPGEPDTRKLWLKDYIPFGLMSSDGSHFTSYGRVEPLATQLALTADAVDVWDHMDEQTKDEFAGALSFSIARNLTEKSYLESMSQLADVVESSHSPIDALNKFAQTMAGSVVPGAVAGIARVEDPVLRERRTILDAIMARIPGMSAELPASRDPWGQPVIPGQSMMTPTYQRQISGDAATAEALRLKAHLGVPERGAKLMGVFELSPQEYSDLMRAGGQAAHLKVTQTIGLPGYHFAPDGFKRQVIEDVYRDEMAMAKHAALMRIQHDDPVRWAQGLAQLRQQPVEKITK